MKQGSWTKQGNREEGRLGLALLATHLQPPGKGWGRLVEHVARWWAAYSNELVVTVTVIIILSFLSWASVFLSQQKRCDALFSLDANNFTFLCHPPRVWSAGGTERESMCARSRTLFMKQGLSLNLLRIRENRLASEFQEFFCPCLSSVGMTCMYQHTYLFGVGSGRFSSGPQASRLGTLQSEPSLQLWFFFSWPQLPVILTKAACIYGLFVWNMVSYTPDWPQICYVANDDGLDFRTSCFHLPNPCIIGMEYHEQFW